MPKPNFPRYCPKIIERCLVIPLVTIVLAYPIYGLLGLVLLGTVGLGYIERIHMISLLLTDKVIACAIVVAFAMFYYILSYLSAYNKQKRQANALTVKISNGYTPTIDEQVDIEKAKSFNNIYKFAIIIGVLASSIISGLVTLYISADLLSTAYQVWGAAFLVSVVVSVVLDKTVIETTANGEFEKVKSQIYETFRKVAETVSDKVNNADLKNLQSLASQFAEALANFGKQ